MYFTELEDMMLDTSKIRTPEQRSRKMLREERIIMNLEMAIKKEEFRDTQKPKPVFHETDTVDKGLQMVSIPVHETNGKISNALNFFLDKIR